MSIPLVLIPKQNYNDIGTGMVSPQIKESAGKQIMVHPSLLDLIHQLKGTIENLHLLCSLNASILSDNNQPLPERSLAELLFTDLAEFFLHISAADGEISHNEITCFKRLFGLKWSRKKILQFCEDKTYPYKTPKILEFFAAADRIEEETTGSVDICSCELLFHCCNCIGSLLVLCDGAHSLSKQNALRTSLSNLKTSINEISPQLQLEV